MSKTKRTPSHSTAIPATQAIYDKLVSLEPIKKMSFGIIEKCKPVRGKKRIKILIETGCLLLKVRDTCSVQELRIFCSNGSEVLPTLKQKLSELDFLVV